MNAVPCYTFLQDKTLWFCISTWCDKLFHWPFPQTQNWDRICHFFVIKLWLSRPLSAFIIIVVTSWWKFNCLCSFLCYFAPLLLLSFPLVKSWSFLCQSDCLQSLNSTVFNSEQLQKTKSWCQRHPSTQSKIFHWEQLPWIIFRFGFRSVKFSWLIHPIWIAAIVVFWISYCQIGFSIPCLHQITFFALSLQQKKGKQK